MQEVPSTRALWKLAWPLALAGLGETLIDLIDLAFLAHYGVVEAGAVALGDAVYETLLIVVLGALEGLQVVLARRAGEGSTAGIGRTFRFGLRVMLVASVLVFLAARLVAPPLLGLVVESEDVLEAAGAFVHVIAYGAPLEAVNLLFAALYLALGRTRVLVLATAAMAAVNVVLDYGLVFGRLGLPELGIAGAAWGSVIAEGAFLVVVAAHAWRRGLLRSHQLLAGPAWNTRLALRLWRVALPAGLEIGLESARWFLVFVLLERLGEEALAASNIVYSCFTLLVIPVEGLAEATCTQVSALIGRGASQRIAEFLRAALRVGWGLTVPLALATALFPATLLALFTDDPALVSAALAPLRVVALGLVLFVPGELLSAALAGTGDTRTTLWIELVVAAAVLGHVYLAGSVLAVPLALVWLFLPGADLVRTTLAAVRLRAGERAHVRV